MPKGAQRHLGCSVNLPPSSKLTPLQPTSADKCTLLLPGVEKPVHLDLLSGEDGSGFIDVRSLFDLTGFCIFDPGFGSTANCCSQITYIDGSKGVLQYRGFDIADLAQNCSYLEVCYLLTVGCLPTTRQLEEFEAAVWAAMELHHRLRSFYGCFEKGAHPMAVMIGAFGALAAFTRGSQFSSTESDRLSTAVNVVAKMPLLAAFAFRASRGLPLVEPKRRYGFVENFLRMTFKRPCENWKLDPRVLRVFEQMMILHADHEQNLSSCTVRIASSSISHPYACIAAGLASLWGPAHGGASEAVVTMLEEMRGVELIPALLQKVKQKNIRLAGFGHRIYRNFDPRAVILKESAQVVAELLGRADDRKLLETALRLERAVLADAFLMEKKLYPNVDFYTGLVLHTIGVPKEMYTVIFAVSRAVGWIAQFNEARSTVVKVGRPRQIYVGALNRSFVKMQDREEGEPLSVAALASGSDDWPRLF